MSQFPRQSLCVRCRRSLSQDPQLSLEDFRELAAAKREPGPDLVTHVNRTRLRALEALAARVRLLSWEETLTGHVLVSPFGWELLIQARDWLAAIDEALASGREPPKSPKC